MTEEERRIARVRAKYLKPIPPRVDVRHPRRRSERHARREAAARELLREEQRLRDRRTAIEEARKAKYREALEQRAERVSREVVSLEHRKIQYGEWAGVLAALGHDSYGAYLASKRWEAIRTKVMWAQRRRCQYCGGAATEVHHEKYTYENIAGIDIDHLKAACRDCHRNQHGLAKG